ncbi:hypothetical protein ACH4SP_03295 [Streptomyces sp. NPDC021093]|uniref:hypothetical protein n=1 Tax=Streptomyces sp. NPDC021093 TaxID=3365112 RepID=UPI00378FEA73
MSRTRTSLAALLLAAAGALGVASPALALAHCPDPVTAALSDEAYERLQKESPDAQELIKSNPAYRDVWLGCAAPSRVEPNVWGQGYVCIPEGAVQ